MTGADGLHGETQKEGLVMKNWRAVAFVAVLFMSVFLSGCGGSDEPILTMPPGSPMPPASKSSRMTVDVYWDATVSMKGFTTLAAGNIYRELPSLLDELGGSLGEARFFRFGEKVTPVEGRAHLRFREPDCYNELITSFGNVLDEADPKNLSIVITDLFENDSDWSNVTQKLREKYFSQHLAVAIIGIKNSFNGDIYDVGINAAHFSYDSADNPARYRPFYLFLMGSEPQVRTFLDYWKAKMPSDEIKYVVFSEHLATYTADMKNIPQENLVGNSELKKADSRLKEVVVVKREKKAKFTLRGNLKQNDDYCRLVNKNLDNASVKVFAWADTAVKGETLETNKENVEETKDDESSWTDKISAWFGKDEETEKDTPDNKNDKVDNKENVEETKDDESSWTDKIFAWFGKDEETENAEDGKKNGWQEQESKGAEAHFYWDDAVAENNCTLELTFHPGVTLPLGRIGLLQVSVVPPRESLQLPEWISEWDMGNIDVTPEQFDGSKTVNLERIASSLKDSLLLAAHPTLAELYLVIDGRR